MSRFLRILFCCMLCLPLRLSAQEVEHADSIPLQVLIDFGKAIEWSVVDDLGASGVLVRSDEILLFVPEEEVPALWEIKDLLDKWATEADSFFNALNCKELVVLSFTPDLKNSKRQGAISMIPITMTYACDGAPRSADLIVLRFEDEPYIYLLKITSR